MWCRCSPSWRPKKRGGCLPGRHVSKARGCCSKSNPVISIKSADEFSTCNPYGLLQKSLYALCVSWGRRMDTVCPPVRSKFVIEDRAQDGTCVDVPEEAMLVIGSRKASCITKKIRREVRQGWNWRQNLHDIFGMRNSYSCHLFITPKVLCIKKVKYVRTFYI